MNTKPTYMYPLIAACALLSLLVPFWPMALLGVALAAFCFNIYSAALLGLFFDLLFGAPTGFLHFIHFPFFIFALLCVVLRALALRYLLESGDLGRV